MTFVQPDSTPSEESSQADSLARTYLSPEKAQDLPGTDQDSSGKSSDFLKTFIPPGSSLKTSLVSCQSTEDGTWAPSSKRWLNAGMASRGECWTLSISESPNVVVESSLSAILEEPDERLRKYFLSAKACQGILRRAGKRNRKLPEALELALTTVANQPPPVISTLQGGGQRGYRIDAEAAAGGHLLVQSQP